MNKINLKNFLGYNEEFDKMDLSLDICKDDNLKKLNQKRIDRLFMVAMDDVFLLYFDGRYVIEPYDGLEFKELRDEFYYNNINSYLVFEDEDGRKVTFKIRYLEHLKFEHVYNVVEKADKYTRAHPEVSEYKLY